MNSNVYTEFDNNKAIFTIYRVRHKICRPTNFSLYKAIIQAILKIST